MCVCVFVATHIKEDGGEEKGKRGSAHGDVCGNRLEIPHEHRKKKALGLARDNKHEDKGKKCCLGREACGERVALCGHVWAVGNVQVNVVEGFASPHQHVDAVGNDEANST